MGQVGSIPPRTGRALVIWIVCCVFALWSPVAANAKSAITGTVSSANSGPITVKVKGRYKTTTVSPSTGTFSLSYRHFGGPHKLVMFQNGTKYTKWVHVPHGSRLSLQQITLNPTGALSAQEEDVTIKGTLKSVDCGVTPPTLTVLAKSGSTMSASFDPSTTYIIDRSTNTVINSCAALAALVPAPVELEATVNPDKSLSAKRIVVNPDYESHPGEVEFNGTVQSNSGCPDSITVTRSDGTNVTVNITSTTRIEIDDSESAAACTDLTVGLPVDVEGALQSDGSVTATNIEGEPVEFDSEGVINDTDCAGSPQSLSFTPHDSSTPLTVTIGATTKIYVNDTAGSCSDLMPGPAQVEGITQPDGSVAAARIEQSSEDGSGDGSGD